VAVAVRFPYPTVEFSNHGSRRCFALELTNKSYAFILRGLVLDKLQITLKVFEVQFMHCIELHKLAKRTRVKNQQTATTGLFRV
jgi:hypothetical protein